MGDIEDSNIGSKEKEHNENTELQEELVPLKPKTLNNATDENPEKTVKWKLTIRERLKLIKENITVEPILICYVMPSVVASLATQNLNLEKACRVNLNYNSTVCDALTMRETKNYGYEEEQVQKLIAEMGAYKNIIQTIIPCFLILFVGAWSDKTGRRTACIMVPIVGEFLTAVGFIVNTYYFDLPVEVSILTEAIFPAITGGWFTNFIGIFSYIGDVTTAEERTYRVGIVNLCSNLGYPVGSALSGVLLSWLGYYGVFTISATMYLFSMIYGFCCLKDPKRKVLEKTDDNCFIGFLKEFFDLNLVKETFQCAFKDGPGNRRLRVCLLLIVVCVVFGPLQGEYMIMYLFTRYRFNWNEVQYSFWCTYSVITNLIGTVFSITLFSKYMKLDDTILGIISNSSKIVASFGYAFARTDLEIYLAPLLEILNGTSFIAMRSIATKLVTGEDLGKVNSLFGLAEAMMPLVYGPLYTRVYMATLTTLPGAVFLLGAALTVPSIFIFGWLYFEHKKDKIRNATVITNEGDEVKKIDKMV